MRREDGGDVDVERAKRLSVHRLPVQVDVEAFDFLFGRHAEPDQGIDDLEDDEGGDGAPGDADQRAPQLGQDLARVAVDQARVRASGERTDLSPYLPWGGDVGVVR